MTTTAALLVLFLYGLPVLAAAAALLGACLWLRAFPGPSLREDLLAYCRRHETRFTFASLARGALGDPALQAVILYRASRSLWRRGWTGAASLLRRVNVFLTGADLSPEADIGPGLEIFHGSGLVVGRGAVIGRGAWLFQGVTVGHSGPGCPRIGDSVKIFAGAKVLGPITVGNESVVGANAVLTRSVPAQTKVTCAPAQVETRAP